MKILKQLGLSIIAICALVVAENPAGAVGCNPGEVQSPPCSRAQSTPSDAAILGETSTPPSASAAIERVVTEAAIGLVQSALSVF